MTEGRENATIGVAAVALAAPTVTASARARANLAAHHLEAATKAARRVRQVEAENAGAELGSFFSDIMQFASVSVVMASAALEANANETISDILDGIAPLVVTRERRELLAHLRSGMVGPEEKYRQLALLLDRMPDRGGAAWQDVPMLLRLRNDLMHFKPAWDDEAVHARMQEKMRSRLGISRFYRSNFVYPHGYFTYETARWSVQSVLAFAAHFSGLIGVKDRFRNTGFDYHLPEPACRARRPRARRHPAGPVGDVGRQTRLSVGIAPSGRRRAAQQGLAREALAPSSPCVLPFGWARRRPDAYPPPPGLGLPRPGSR